MKIGVNASPLLKPFTGIGQYTKNLFKSLAEIDSENEYILVAHSEIPQEVSRIFPKNVELKILHEKKFPLAGMKKTWWEQISLPEYFEKIGVDIAFFPYPSNPWTKDWYKKGIKTVVTVHDCIPWMHRGYRRGLLSKLYHWQTKKAVKMADIVLTVSEASKKKIMNICDVPAEKVHIVYNDAGDVYKKEIEKNFAEKFLAKFGLKQGKFFLYCGGYDERKNVKYLIAEYLNGKFSVPLVLAGEKLFNNKLYLSFDKNSASRADFDRRGASRYIIKTGFLNGKELAVLYSSCLAFVHLSKEEGFNIPLLEAANCGAPLILSDIEVHKEIAGDKALYVDINKRGAATLAMGAKEFISSAGLAEKYSWKKSAQKVKNVIFS